MFKRFLRVGLVTIFILGSVGTLHAAAMPWIQLLLLDDGVTRPPTIINVPDDYNTIQAAIDSAINGDQIVVAPGTYQENINFKGKAIKIESSQGPGITTIDGDNAGSVVTFSNGESRNSQIEGFSIINGTGTTNPDPNINNGGGGILCVSSSPTIKNNLIYNSAAGYGGGILSTDVSNHISSPEITGNTIYDNVATLGAGIFCNYSSPEITGNTIRGNNATGGGGGIACWHSSSPVILNNRIYDNIADSLGGGGIRLYNLSEAQIINNTVYGNSTSGSGGALYIRHSMPTVKNTIFWNNDATVSGDEIWAGAANMVPPDPPPLKSSVLEIEYSNVQGGNTLPGVFVEPGSDVIFGLGMIDADPLFINSMNGDFHLEQNPPQFGVDSPCVDTGDPASAWQDGSTRTDDVLDSGIVDMGFHYTD